MPFTSGMQVPAGTTANVAGSLHDYFLTLIAATLFQPQVIDLIVIVAAVMVAWYIVRSVQRRLLISRTVAAYRSIQPRASSETERRIKQNNDDYAILHAKRPKKKA